MQKAPLMKGSGLAPIEDEPVHVFGRNLEERVVAREEAEVDDKRGAEDEEDKRPDDDVEAIKKRKFDAITGEENEVNSFQSEFKLFVWDFSTSNWIEKGRGLLKLNDDLTDNRSRLIMRAGGTFRIILNVAIRHSLFKVINITKTSIRFTDSQNVWAASGSNARLLGDLLNERIAEAAEESQCGQKQEVANQEDTSGQFGSSDEETDGTLPLKRTATSQQKEEDSTADDQEDNEESETELNEEEDAGEEERIDGNENITKDSTEGPSKSPKDSEEGEKLEGDREENEVGDNDPVDVHESASDRPTEEDFEDKTIADTAAAAKTNLRDLGERQEDEKKRLKLSSD